MTVTDCVTLRIFEVGSTDGNRVIGINVMQTSKRSSASDTSTIFLAILILLILQRRELSVILTL
ncbi:hypothetical protein L8P23_23740 [Enterobacter roggenkampii]|uniref:hypothetical protein n=1 Tax=Enterobacter roggenkampii TaxID=1812935 RepID=UPI002006B06B|nr:hypothetical protein [Enterobacter roggenkampii]MCK7235075.1 hypothetical protein [Enterobacter roggenkampii]